MAQNRRTPKTTRPRAPTKQTRLKVRKYRSTVQRFRGRRSTRKETVERVYSERRETKAVSPMVAYAPYATEQLPSLESTAINAMKYDPKTNLLWITFWGYKQKYVGSTYVFYKVPPSMWTGLNEASSKGRYFYYMIRNKFRYSRVS